MQVPLWQTSFPILPTAPSANLPPLNFKYSPPVDRFKKFTFPFSDFFGKSELIGSFLARGHIRYVSIEYPPSKNSKDSAVDVAVMMAVVVSGPELNYAQVGGCTSNIPYCKSDWYFGTDKIFVQRWPLTWGFLNSSDTVQATRDVSGARLYSLNPFAWKIYMYFGFNSTTENYPTLPSGMVVILTAILLL